MDSIYKEHYNLFIFEKYKDIHDKIETKTNNIINRKVFTKDECRIQNKNHVRMIIGTGY